MAFFLLRRIATMLLTALCLTFIVFWLTNLAPNLEKLAKNQGNVRMTDEQVASFLQDRGYAQPLPLKYAQWLGVAPGWVIEGRDGTTRSRCNGALENGVLPEDARSFCGVLQGDWGYSTVFQDGVGSIIATRLGLTGKLMFWVMMVMVPGALIIGVLAGMREGSRTDRSLSTVSIITTATPEYVSGVVFIAVFASTAFGLRWFNGSATSAMENATFENFTLPVMTIALYGMGYIARMTRASMAEVMTAQYIRTARLKGVSFPNIVLKHALRNALIAPFTVIMLQFPWLLNGVVIVETLFNYKGFGWTLVQAAGNNDIELLLGVSVVSVFVVLITQLISDIGYVYLNPRISVS
ncbi:MULTISPECIES: ABC transporter permease [Marivita]|uniref:ABC transporter permease n=1 Tax=Marivita cryptomonadis TaxID=505252 RepID=A0A9Q2S5E8_9RHOB|nr:MULTISPECIES: ABC transporter permease [Marivita]MCR9167679.1 ABC transporter permease [Paracoccaceae bacterium]MBM2322084.1 ABC transporter permease [Marivita cryptomonadis]MBM2331665.1 ABC transporter permease [Marivita cryptomonadis]MBM2341250.1 ABC transporter permease [Marivita cryptomonadis]MBM2345913.1 ABC transporter permease [Marivita cryptomonadis]